MIHSVYIEGMNRPSSSTRLGDLARAGMQTFGRLGYRRTKMAEVSAAAGLSTGAIYTYVESKEALLHLVFAWFFADYTEEAMPELPDRSTRVRRHLGAGRFGVEEGGRDATPSECSWKP